MRSPSPILLLVTTCCAALLAPTAGYVARAAAANPAPDNKSKTKPAVTRASNRKKGSNGNAAKPARGKKSGNKKSGAKRRVLLEKHVMAVKGHLPNVLSLGALAIDLDSGQEIFARKPDQPRAVASISKLAATLVVMDHHLDLEGLTTIKKIDAEVARGGAPSRLLEGMTLSNRDLLHAALLGSDNRAVSALGRAAGLSATQLTNAMNRKVASLELRATRFREPTGLSPENVSTPREILQLLRAAMSHPVLGSIVRKPEYEAHPVGRPGIKYVSTHRPAARPSLQILGGKTGYNDAARYCLVIAVRIDNRNYGMALLGTEGKLTRFGDMARVADWIVAHRAKLTVTPLVPGPPLPADFAAIPQPTGKDAEATPQDAARDQPD